MAAIPVLAMHEMIEAYGEKTNKLCHTCKNRNRGIKYLYEVEYAKPVKGERQVFLVCAYCDVEADQAKA